MRHEVSRVVVALLLLSVAGHAGEPPAAKEKARVHFKAGSAFLEAGVYDKAISEYLEAYRLLPLPDFLFNLGQAYRLQGTAADLQKAAQYYRQYLAQRPDGVGAAEAREHLASIEPDPGAAPSGKEAAPATPSLPPPPAARVNEPPPSVVVAPAAAATDASATSAETSIARRPAFWVVLVGVVVLVGAGIAAGVVFTRARDPVPSVDVIDFGLRSF